MEQREDPVLVPFLQMLDDHISAHSKHLQPMATDLVARLEEIVGSVDVDLNSPLAAGNEDLK